MNKIEIDFENCYGINKLKSEIYLTDRVNKKGEKVDIKNVCNIYASNGTMKTSFANTMADIQHEKETKDRIYGRDTKRMVKIDGVDIDKDQVLVISSYDNKYDFYKETRLLVSDTLKKKYDTIYNDININKENLYKFIKKTSGISNFEEIEKEITCLFDRGNSQDILNIFESVYKNETLKENVLFDKLKYKDLVNDDIANTLSDKDFSMALTRYIDKYNEILETSEIYKPGIYDNTKAQATLKNLQDNNFFRANHKIILENNEQLDEKQFKNKMIEVETKVLTDESMQKEFKNIEDILNKKISLKKFKEIVYENQTMITLLQDYTEFKKSIWLNYMFKAKDMLQVVVNIYNSNKEEIRAIIQEAKNEKTLWDEVTRIFNERFKVPFRVLVDNQEDVILNEKTPTLVFKYKDEKDITDGIKVEERLLNECLSRGERSALYILNILFKLKAKESENKECLLILDDIADSFDYKNKYAIIEYLKDIQEKKKMKMIILTHNFDFYRSVASRLDIENNSFFAIRNENEILIEKGQYTRNVFSSWKSNIYNNNKIFIASIPFIRNIVEYINGIENNNYKLLTFILHYIQNPKEGISKTDDIQIKDVVDIYEKTWNIDKNKVSYDLNKSVIDFIFECAEEIIKSNDNNEILLENKIVLSMAIRLKSEIYMINRINDKNVTDTINKDQTRGLRKKIMFSNDEDDIKREEIVEQVLLMTSENIHMNSFMYEPLIDMSLHSLIKLYQDVTNL